MRLETLRLKNFLSFKGLNHTFRNGATLIQGRNLTEDSKETNGAGKSTMEAGISYALMATPLRKQTLDRDLIRWGEDEAEIELTVFCPVRSQRLRIFRRIRVKGSATLELYVNEQSVQFASVLEGNRYILDWIAITPEDLKSFYILNKENYKSFLSASNTDKLALINRFMKAERLEAADDVIKERSLPYVEKRDAAQRKVFSIEGELNAYKGQLVYEQSRNLDEELEQQVATINERIEQYRQKIQTCEDASRRMEESRGEVEANIIQRKESLDTVKRSLEAMVADNSLEQQKESIRQERQGLDNAASEARNFRSEEHRQLDETNRKLAELNKMLAGVVTCPHCHHRFLLNDTECSVAELEDEKATVTYDADAHSSAIEEVNAVLDELAADLSTYDCKEKELAEAMNRRDAEISTLRKQVADAERVIYAKEAILSQCNESVRRNNSTIESLRKDIQQEQQRIAVLMEDGIQTKVEDYKGLITLTEKKLDRAQKELEKAESELGELQQWGQRFKDFRMSLACGQLKVIQDVANLSLERQRSELRVSIDGFKVNAKGQVKSEITVLVINGEGEYKSFWSYSGGERARVEMAMIQAFQEMLNATNPYGGLNFLMIDEVLEGTDPLGLNLLIESLKDVENPVYIISHVMNIKAGVPTLTITKENGISRIE